MVKQKLNSTLTLSRNNKFKWKVTDTNLEGIHVKLFMFYISQTWTLSNKNLSNPTDLGGLLMTDIKTFLIPALL